VRSYAPPLSLVVVFSRPCLVQTPEAIHIQFCQ
jgi:hypothetical protein